MRKRLALFIAFMLSMALWTTGLSADPIHTALMESALAEAQADGAPKSESGQADAEPAQQPDGAPEAKASDAPPPSEEVPTQTEMPEAHTESPAQETPGAEASPEPTLSPSESNSESPTPMPTPTSSEAPADAPSDAPAQSPTIIPSETPTPTEDAPAGACQVSPAVAVYMLGSLEPLTFSITPHGAPFIGIDGFESAYADGVVTIPQEAIDSLGEGDHILKFLFENDKCVDVKLKIVAAQLATKGSVDVLIIDNKIVNASIDDTKTTWTWNAATSTLTLDGYDGGKIQASRSGALTVVTASSSVNTITSSDEGSLRSDNGLILKGSGTLNVINDTENAVVCNDTIHIEGGTVRARGKKRAFYSKQGEIRVSGGKVEVVHANRQGDGFSAMGSTKLSGGSISVEGAETAFGSLVVNGGSVTIRNCETGISGGLSASGGEITIKDVAETAAVSGQDMRFTGCTLSIRDCGEYGLNAGGGLTIGKGANFKIEAKKFALYAPGRAGTISIEKGANLDLSGGEGALSGGKVVIGGKAYTGAYNHLVIQNGVIVRKENAMQSLAIGGQPYGVSKLSNDLVGDGWEWAAATRTLTLNGYDGPAVGAVGSPITLSLIGENKIRGGLTVSGAVVTGGGSLTASRVVGKADFVVQSGTVSAAQISLGGGFTVSGGAVILSGDSGGPAVECGNLSLTGGGLTLSSPDGSQPAGIRALGAASFRGGALTVRNFGDCLIAAGDVSISGGSISIDNTGSGITSGKTLKATGGSVSIKTNLGAMTAKNIAISGKPTLRLESTTLTAFNAKTVKIAGKVYAPRYPGVIIEGGKLVEGYKLLPDLVIGDRELTMKELNAGDQSGDGWSWSAKKNALTLSGYHGKGIWINRNLTVTLAPGTSSSGNADYGGGEAAIYSTEDLALTGSGRWSGGLLSERRLRISGSPHISASVIRSPGGVSILGGRIDVSGGIEAENGNVLIESSSVTAGRVSGARVELRKSSLTTAEKGSAGDPDLKGERGLTISSSIVFCTRFGASSGKVKLSGSPVFLRGSGSGREVWMLAQSASISRDMTVPLGKDCLVPAGRTLSIAKGKRLYVLGSLVVNGALKGTVVSRNAASGVNILGSAQVAKGRSVRLSAQVLPAVPGGQADQAVAWSSDSPKLLNVSDNGVVTATALSKPGDKANITCRALDGTGVEETLRMTVTVPVTKLEILRSGAPAARLNVSRNEGPLALDVRIEPEAASHIVRWTSSSPTVASVDPETGVVRLLKKGTVTIRCTAMDGTNAAALVKLTVN